MTTAPTTPYDSAQDILDLARAISADSATANGLAGDILANDQPYVFPMLAKIYRDLQDELISKSSEIMNKYGFLLGLGPTDFDNPRINVTVSYLGYTYGPDEIDENVVLPPDLIKPLELWECISGQQNWIPMRPAADSIASRPTTSRFRIWDFQGDVLILPGASQTNDLKMKYVCKFPDITAPTDDILILHSQTFLANQLVAEVSGMLGGLEMAAVYEKEAIKAKDRIVNRTARKEQYMAFNRVPFRGRRSSGRGRR